MTVAELKAVLDWAKFDTDYDTTYEEVVAEFGVEGLFVDEYEAFDKPFCRYRWIADEENYITITFEIQADGTKTWNVTAWEGLK